MSWDSWCLTKWCRQVPKPGDAYCKNCIFKRCRKVAHVTDALDLLKAINRARYEGKRETAALFASALEAHDRMARKRLSRRKRGPGL